MFRCCLDRFRQEEDGAASWFGVVFLFIVLMIGGVAIDVSRVIDERTRLQVAADAAAHAALLRRQSGTSATAKSAAVDIARRNLPAGRNGEVLRPENIQFGLWTGGRFTPDAGSRYAVRVVTQQTEANGNAVQTFLMKMAGIPYWDVQTVSIFALDRPHCFRDGFVSNTRIDIQGNNSFHNQFCLLSNDTIKLGSNNAFESGVSVQLPSETKLQLPSSGFSSNPGLREALTFGTENIRILQQLPQLIENLKVPTHPDQPSYITVPTVQQVTTKKIEEGGFTEGAVHLVSCSRGGPQINVKAGTIFRNMVLVTDCQVKFEQGVALENAVLATTNTDPKSFNSPSGLRLGRVDNCAPGGGARLLTLGGVDVASGLELHGSQIVAAGNVTFSAGSGGLMGASIIAGGTISGTSNMVMGLCTTGLDDMSEVDYFRMVH